MKLKAKPISFDAGGKGIVVLNKHDAESIGAHALDRLVISKGKRNTIAILDVTERTVSPGTFLVNEEGVSSININPNESIDVSLAPPPESMQYIKDKIAGNAINHEKAEAIIRDVVEKHLSDIELSAFVTALDIRGLSIDEAAALSLAMIETGKRLKIKGNHIIADKHSAGGVPGDKTSIIVVPIIAAGGLIIPKTSSRAITSPAGTADRMEVLAPVSHSIEEIEKIVNKVKACLVWGGALDLAPADDAFIKIEYPIGIDPLLLPSIMSKKKAVGATHLVVDLPTGRGAKIKTIGEADALAAKFVELGDRLGIKVSCAVTFGEQPIGHGIGPALEAKEALMTFSGKGSPEVEEKAVGLAAILFESALKIKNGKAVAEKLLKSGKAEKKLREIIAAQGGNDKVRSDDIALGSKTADVKAEKDGMVLWMMNQEIAHAAREAGAPKDKGAGMWIYHKLGSKVKKGDKLCTIYSNNSGRLQSALDSFEKYKPIIIAKGYEEKMIMEKIIARKVPHRRIFALER